jgi:hypothetical protein
MIVQMTLTRNECFLIKEMLPLWKRYADGFVFMVDKTTDDTIEYLNSVKEEYNILEILHTDYSDPKNLETNWRQKLFDTARKYTNKIICCDTDEYIDGTATKEELEHFLDNAKNSTVQLQWIQYTGKNQIRVDGPWRVNFHDRMGVYNDPARFENQWLYNHTSHMPPTSNNIRVDPKHLFIAHLQWLDKRWVGIKQYYWKIWDYVNHLEHGANILNRGDYDVSVANFDWQYEHFDTPLKLSENIYSTQSVEDNYKLKYIVEQTNKYNIPNLNDWGMGIYEYCLKNKNVTDKRYSICITTFKEREEIASNLITSIANQVKNLNIDIIVIINGNNDEKMDNEYRARMLTLCSNITNCYPIVCPEFKSLAKLWNTAVIFSNTQYNLILNDDINISNNNFFDILAETINNTSNEFFTINGSFSHFVITKNILHKLNYFDERLIAFGEEDGDIIHRYILATNSNLPTVKIDGFNNSHAYNLTSKNLEIHIDNKPRFNREFINLKYTPDSNGIYGMSPVPVKKIIDDTIQYPYEMFVLNNKHNIQKFEKVILD